MLRLSAYVLDREAIRLDAYRLLCLFYANKEIARQSDPVNHRPDPAQLLERRYFPREVTRLLLSIAIALRTLDDQMEHLPVGDPDRQKYMQAREYANRQHLCMMFDEMSLREVCNKIIHATVVEPHTREGVESHQYDEYMWEAWQQNYDEAGSTELDRLKLYHGNISQAKSVSAESAVASNGGICSKFQRLSVRSSICCAMRPNPPLHPTCYGWLRQPPPAGELQR